MENAFFVNKNSFYQKSFHPRPIPGGGKILHTLKMPFHIDPLNEVGILGLQADVTELETLRKAKMVQV